MQPAQLHRGSSVCALIPHFECEQWLGEALESLVAQTRPLDAIVVIDDCSPTSPEEVVRSYPSVTLLGSAENVGPYRLIQQVIDDTGFDAYLFQDADDWSAPDRLERLLEEAESSGAELVGSHEVRVMLEEGEAKPFRYPLDVNAALHERPACFPLLHPTSLVSRSLVQRLGGFATGLRFSGDAEFLRRAGHASRVVNVDRYLYFRRKRAGSLTTSPETGLRSPARLEVRAMLAARANANAARGQAGEAPDLAPVAVGVPVTLHHRCGPLVSDHRPGGKSVPPSRPHAPRPVRAVRRPRSGAAGGPVFVIGAPRAGLSLLAWSLAQHPGFEPMLDGRWLATLAASLGASREGSPGGADRFLSVFRGAIEDLIAPPGSRVVAAHPELTLAAPVLADLFPEARFLHVARTVDEVVDSFVRFPTEDGAFLTSEQAVGAWLRTARSAVELERRLGPDAVLRVQHADLYRYPEETMRRCASFLGERFDARCLRPLRDLQHPAVTSNPVILEAAWSLSAALVSGRQIADLPDIAGQAAPTASPPAQVSANGNGMARTIAERVRAMVAGCVPPSATVVVASKGDPELVELGGRQGWHFPQVEGGIYAGHHPADSDEAIRQLSALEYRGAQYFAIPASGLWWVDFYTGLDDWLRRHCRLVAYEEGVGALWRLGAAPEWRLAHDATATGVVSP